MLRGALVQLAIGLSVGMAGAFAVGRLLASLLVHTSTTDPLSLRSIAALMATVSIAACVARTSCCAARSAVRPQM